jgi:hypothetical protein
VVKESYKKYTKTGKDGDAVKERLANELSMAECRHIGHEGKR